jgi:hypothetical protein
MLTPVSNIGIHAACTFGRLISVNVRAFKMVVLVTVVSIATLAFEIDSCY